MCTAIQNNMHFLHISSSLCSESRSSVNVFFNINLKKKMKEIFFFLLSSICSTYVSGKEIICDDPSCSWLVSAMMSDNCGAFVVILCGRYDNKSVNEVYKGGRVGQKCATSAGHCFLWCGHVSERRWRERGVEECRGRPLSPHSEA